MAETTITKPKQPSKVKLAQLALTQAETAKVLAEADVARENALDAAIERRVTEARAKQAELELQGAEIAIRDILRSEARYEASDSQNHVYQFDGPVTAAAVKAAISTLSYWSRLAPKCDIEIVFNSPGGSVIDGMALWDHLSALKAKGHKLTTVTRGLAASMASILFQVGHERVMGPESYQLIHEVSFGAHGKPGDVEDTVDWINKITRRVLRIYAERSTLTEKQIALRWARKDWTVDADECVKLGLADRIG